MSVVDTWNWDKVKPTEEDYEVTADEKVQAALYNFQSAMRIRPNRITMGSNLVDELSRQFYSDSFPMKSLEEIAKEQKLGVVCQYEGIPVKVDYDNPDVLEVGYMMKLWY